MVNRIFENISNLIYLVGDKYGCKSNSKIIDRFIEELAPVKGKRECLSDRYVQKFIKGEVKDIELLTLFSIAYSFDISMDKFMLDKDKFEEMYKSNIILERIKFDLCRSKLKKKFITQFQYQLNDIVRKRYRLNRKSQKYFLSKEYDSKYIFELLSKKTNKLPRLQTTIAVLEAIEYKEVDIFMKELYDSWSKEVKIYYKR